MWLRYSLSILGEGQLSSLLDEALCTLPLNRTRTIHVVLKEPHGGYGLLLGAAAQEPVCEAAKKTTRGRLLKELGFNRVVYATPPNEQELVVAFSRP